MRRTIVVKIGGSILRDASSYNLAASKILHEYNENGIVVVVSAMNKVTDTLISIMRGNFSLLKEIEENHTMVARELGGERLVQEINELLTNLRSAILAYYTSQDDELSNFILSFGERMSSILMRQAFLNNGANSSVFHSDKLLILDSSSRKIDYQVTFHNLKKSLSKCIENSIVTVIEGFIAGDFYGKIYTLGRGGSDYTATIAGVALGAEFIRLVTDTPGIFSVSGINVVNPRVVRYLDYEEAHEASLHGVKKFHKKTFEPLLLFNPKTRVFVGSIDKLGTEITNEVPEEFKNTIKLVACETLKKNKVSKVALIGNKLKNISTIKHLLEIVDKLGIELEGIKFNSKKPCVEILVSSDCLNVFVNELHEKLINSFYVTEVKI